IQAQADVMNGSYGPPEPALQYFLTDKDGNLLKDKKGQFIKNEQYQKLSYQAIYDDPRNLAETADVLRAATSADMVLVFAAGNDADSQPDGYSAIPSGAGLLPLITPENTKSG